MKNPAKNIRFQTFLNGGLGHVRAEKKAINPLSAIHLVIDDLFGDRKALNLKGQKMHHSGELIALALQRIRGYHKPRRSYKQSFRGERVAQRVEIFRMNFQALK